MYAALLSVAPVSSPSVGAPPAVLTTTSSLNATVMLIMAPVPYVPSASGDETLATVGAIVSVPGVGVGAAGVPTAKNALRRYV